jgi:DNA-binding transcriptional regulator YiaG
LLHEYQALRVADAEAIDTIERIKQLKSAIKEAEQTLFDDKEFMDQLFQEDFVPEKPHEKIPEIAPSAVLNYEGTIGYKVRQLRETLNESQKQFGERFNVTQGEVSQWENNKKEPPRDVLEIHKPSPKLSS